MVKGELQSALAERLVTLPATPRALGQPVQLVVDQRQQLVERTLLSRPQILEQRADGWRGGVGY